jgi:hypothetical protein
VELEASRALPPPWGNRSEGADYDVQTTDADITHRRCLTLKSGDPRLAIKVLSEANMVLDTWIRCSPTSTAARLVDSGRRIFHDFTGPNSSSGKIQPPGHPGVFERGRSIVKMSKVAF